MRYRPFVLTFAIIMTLFVAGNYAIWKTVTEDLITDRHFDGGDLSRMGYIPGSKMFRHNTTDLPRRHMSLKEYDGRRMGMITIGDSFSNGGGGGYNRFYQDYIASNESMEVLNLSPLRGIDFITTISLWLNSGFLERAKPRFVLVSATEIGWRELAQPIDFDRRISQAELEKLPIVNHYGGLPKVPFINDGNLKFLVFNLLYRFSDHAFFSKVHRAKLNRDFFSVTEANTLLYLPFRHLPTVEDVTKVNDNLNTLADRLRVKGIRLVFMPFADKYTLYAPFLESKPYAESSFFEYLRPLSKRYRWIDSKAILRQELQRGDKDIFYADDTHTTWKASRSIFSTVRLEGPEVDTR